jgi:NTE family protein
LMSGLDVASKLNADWDFLLHLRDAGRAQADTWLTQNFAKIGIDSTVDIHEKYL